MRKGLNKWHSVKSGKKLHIYIYNREREIIIK